MNDQHLSLIKNILIILFASVIISSCGGNNSGNLSDNTTVVDGENMQLGADNVIPLRVLIQETIIPDDNFSDCLSKHAIASPHKVYADEITYLYCGNMSIHDVSGIDQFENLSELHLPNNKISEIDISKNPKLETLSLAGNNMNKIDISNNLKLEALSLSGATLNDIKIPHNSDIIYLHIAGPTEITNIDFSNAINLETVIIDKSLPLDTTIDLRKNRLLRTVNIGSIHLDGILLPDSESLEVLKLWGSFKELDLSSNPGIKELSVSSNARYINTGNLKLLENLFLSGPEILLIDTSSNPNIKYLGIRDAPITTLDLSFNVKLEGFSVLRTQLQHLDLSQNPKLTSLDLRDNQLDSLIMPPQADLTEFMITDNSIVCDDITGSNVEYNKICCDVVWHKCPGSNHPNP